jgi:hypothetical protein
MFPKFVESEENPWAVGTIVVLSPQSDDLMRCCSMIDVRLWIAEGQRWTERTLPWVLDAVGVVRRFIHAGWVESGRNAEC